MSHNLLGESLIARRVKMQTEKLRRAAALFRQPHFSGPGRKRDLFKISIGAVVSKTILLFSLELAYTKENATIEN